MWYKKKIPNFYFKKNWKFIRGKKSLLRIFLFAFHVQYQRQKNCHFMHRHDFERLKKISLNTSIWITNLEISCEQAPSQLST